MNKIPVLIILISTLSCILKTKIGDTGIIQLKTTFYDSSGAPSFTDTKKVWYRDSVSIEKVNKTVFSTIGSAPTTVTYEPLVYRFIDLRKKEVYDYKNFSDTAVAFYKATLPDSMMKDYGWSYYSDRVRRIEGTPHYINDTTIENVVYKRLRFNFIGDDRRMTYKIGYMRCDGKGILFSLEKKESQKLNCTMTKFEDFKIDQKTPAVTIEIEFLSDSLSKQEIKVLDSWKRNATLNPVNRQ